MKQGKVSIEAVLRYMLIFLLIFDFTGSVFISIINPESYFFGKKLGGVAAAAYLLTNGIFAILIAFILLRKRATGAIMSILYFGYNFIEILITNAISFGAYIVSPLFTAGLTISIALYMIHKIRSETKRKA